MDKVCSLRQQLDSSMTIFLNKTCLYQSNTAVAEQAYYYIPIKPAGKVKSVLTLPSTLINLCMTIFFASSYESAYLSLFLMNRIMGRDSLSLCGPELGLGANTPESLSSIQCLGAASLFKCFFGPRA